MQLDSYLLFNGNCEEAFKFYERVFGGKIEGIMNYTGSPAEQQVPAEWREKVLHARMTLGDDALMASDAPPGQYQKPQGFSVSVQLKDPVEGKRIFEALAEDGTVTMAFESTFWSPGFGMCTDRFGIPWMVNTGGEE